MGAYKIATNYILSHMDDMRQPAGKLGDIIIYCSVVANVNWLYYPLSNERRPRGRDIEVYKYHARMNAEEKESYQEPFTDGASIGKGHIKIMIATNALGQ